MRGGSFFAVAGVILVLSKAAAAEEDGEGGPNPRWELGVDSLLSTVHVPIVTVTTGPGAMTTRTEEDARIFVRNVTATAAFRVTDHVRVGALLPWTASTITVGDRRSRGATSFGNAELDGWFEHSPFAHATLTYGLGLSGATAQGETSLPSDQASSDQEATNRAVTASGGRVVNARYAPQHYAVILSVGLSVRRGALQLEPYLRITDLRDQSAAPLHRDTLQNELGARIARRFGPFDAGLRGWIDWVPVGLSDRDRSVAVSVEPEGRIGLGPCTVILGVIVPLVTPNAGPRIVAGELGVVVGL